MTGVLNPQSSVFVPLQINQATHDQALVLQSALQNIPNPASECMLRNVAIRLAQQISDEVRRVLTHAFNRVTTASQKEYDRKRLLNVLAVSAPELPELLPSIQVHPRSLCDPGGAEDRVGFRLWHGTAGLQL